MNRDFSQMMRGYEIHRQAASVDSFMNECTIKVATPQANEIDLKLAEVYDMKYGKIQSVRIYYDPREFVQVFS